MPTAPHVTRTVVRTAPSSFRALISAPLAKPHRAATNVSAPLCERPRAVVPTDRGATLATAVRSIPHARAVSLLRVIRGVSTTTFGRNLDPVAVEQILPTRRD